LGLPVLWSLGMGACNFSSSFIKERAEPELTELVVLGMGKGKIGGASIAS
jgi:hypothetical protein